MVYLFIEHVISTVTLYPDGDVLSFCEDDAFAITCVTNTGLLVWSSGDSTVTFSHILHSVGSSSKLDNSVTFVLVSSSVSQFTSVATVLEAQSTLNGTVLSCKDNGNEDDPEESKTFLIAGNT